MIHDRLVSVAVPVPALDLLTYKVPAQCAMPAAGTRVVVPLGKRRLTGVVIGVAEPPPGDVELREFEAVLDAHPFLPRDVIELAGWVSDYYLAGPGAALAMAMPPHALTNRADAHRTVRYVALTAEGHDLAGQADDAVLTGRQRDAVEGFGVWAEGMATNISAREAKARAVFAKGMGHILLVNRTTSGLVYLLSGPRTGCWPRGRGYWPPRRGC